MESTGVSIVTHAINQFYFRIRDSPVLLASFTDGRSVHDGHDLLCMVTQDAVEQFLVPVLKIAQVHVLVDGFLKGADVLHHDLCLNRL